MPSPRWRRRKPHERQTFTVPVNQPRGPRPGPEILPWYWHPDREGSQRPPEAFDRQLKEIDKDLYVTFSPVHERWILWVRNPRIGQDPDPQVREDVAMICKGWQLLMLWEKPETDEQDPHGFLPLTELLFHNIYLIAAERYPNAKAYFLRIQEDIRKKVAARAKTLDEDRKAEQEDFRKAIVTPSTAGTGSKSALNDSLVPSRNEANWRQERRRWRLPSAMLKQEQDEKEKQFYGR